MNIEANGHMEEVNGSRVWRLNSRLHRIDGPAIEHVNGDRHWYVDGLLHRVDGPAIEKADGSREWYQGGQRHRTDGPAIEYPNGGRQWFEQDICHRTDGPAIERADGSREWWVEGHEHRDDGPAVVEADGTREWRRHGHLHRIDGPAVERADGTWEWWIDGDLVRTSDAEVDAGPPPGPTHAFALCWAAPQSASALRRQQLQAVCAIEGELDAWGARSTPDALTREATFKGGVKVRLQLQPEPGAAQVTVVVKPAAECAISAATRNVRSVLANALRRFYAFASGISLEPLEPAEHGPFQWQEAPHVPSLVASSGVASGAALAEAAMGSAASVEERIASAFPSAPEHSYDAGFRDCIESVMLHLETASAPEALREELLGTVLDAHANNAPEAPAGYLVIQEGGTSEEIYIHVSTSAEDAEAHRRECASGAYRTSAVFEVPEAVAAVGEEAYAFIESVARAVVNGLDCPDVDEEAEERPSAGKDPSP